MEHSMPRRGSKWARNAGLVLVGLMIVIAFSAGPARASQGGSPEVCNDKPSVKVTPRSGPAGTSVVLDGKRFSCLGAVGIRFLDADGTAAFLGTTTVDKGKFSFAVTVPDWAAVGAATFSAGGILCVEKICYPFGDVTIFTVT